MKNKSLIQVLIAIIAAFIIGLWAGPDTKLFGINLVRVFNLIGQLFLNALTLMMVPLVSSSIILGTARMGGDKSFGSLGSKTFGFYVLTSFLAVLVGYFLVNFISPGQFQSEALSIIEPGLRNLAPETGDAFDKVEQLLFHLVPDNVLAVASKGQMLGIIFFCLLFGYFASRIESQYSNILLGFWSGVFQVMMSITQLVMKALPIGVFGLVAKVAATTGIDAIKSLALFFCTVLLGLFIFACIILPLLLKTIARVNPWRHFQAMAPALFTAFSTSSSAASLPIAIECVEKRAGVSNRICSFTVPLGASINLTGTALYICVVVFFVAQAYQFHMDIPTQITIILMSLLTSMGMAGIPSASLVAIMIILQSIGLPAEGIALVLAVERILDMCRTTVNVFGNTCCAVLVARTEGENNVLKTVHIPA